MTRGNVAGLLAVDGMLPLSSGSVDEFESETFTATARASMAVHLVVEASDDVAEDLVKSRIGE